MEKFADAVTKLTREHFTQVSVRGELKWHTQAALLQQLHDAQYDGKGSSKTSALRSERAPVDIAVLDLLDGIREKVETGLYDVGVERTGDLIGDTEALYARLRILHKSGQIEERWFFHYMNKFPQWVQEIENALGRPGIPVDAPCPECGELEWWNRVAARSEPALIIRLDRFLTYYASCRKCRVTWYGVDEIRKLGVVVNPDMDTELVDELLGHAD